MKRTPTGDAPGAFVGAADEREPDDDGWPAGTSVRRRIDADGVDECHRLALAFADAATVVWNMTDEPGELPLATLTWAFNKRLLIPEGKRIVARRGR